MASIDSAFNNDTCVQIKDWARSRTQKKLLLKQESTVDMVSVGCANKLMENLAGPQRDRLLEWIGVDKVTKERAKIWNKCLMSKDAVLALCFTEVIDVTHMLHNDALHNKLIVG